MDSDPAKRIERYFSDNGLDLEKACKKASEKAVHIIDHREYESIALCLREYPAGTPRPRTFNGHTFSPNAAENKRYFEKAIKQVAVDISRIYTPTEVRIDAYMEMPQNVKPDEVILYEAKLLHAIGKPDADNLAKTYLDMMTDVLTTDDDLFYHLDIYKWYSLEPRVEIRITYETALESEYLYKKLKNRKAIKRLQKTSQLELRRI